MKLKMLALGLIIALSVCGCSDNKKAEDIETKPVENIEKAEVTEENKEVDRTNVVAEDYIDAVKWILNPNAGPVYWGQTYPEYEKYISKELLDKRIDEYYEQGKVDTALYGMTEPEYNLKVACKHPEYNAEQDIYNSYNSYEKEMTLTYEEFMSAEYKEYRYLCYHVAQDRDYLEFDAYSQIIDTEDAYKRLEESFKKPVWLLEVSKDNGTEFTGIIEITDTGTFEHYIGRISTPQNIGETEYKCYLDDENKIYKIETFMQKPDTKDDTTYGYSDENTGWIGSKYFGYEDYDPSKGDEYYLDKQGLKNEDVSSNGEPSEEVDKPNEDASEFDKAFYEKNGRYPDESTIQKRIVANGTLTEKYKLNEIEKEILNVANEYCEHPVLTAVNDYGDYLQLRISNPFFESVYGEEPEYIEWVILVHVDGRYKAVFAPTFNFEKGFEQ